MTDQAVSTFEQNLRGRLIRPTDADYDAARAVYNGMIDKRPRLIARAVNVADVITAVNFARDQDLLLAIRGGGHNGPGLGSCNDGLVIDLSMMKGVRVDPDTQDRPGRTRLHVRRRRSRDACLRAGRAVRHRLHHRCRRPDARRRHRLPHAQVSGSRSTTCSKPTSCWPTAGSSRRARARIRICSGRCAAAAATSASSPASCSRRTR